MNKPVSVRDTYYHPNVLLVDIQHMLNTLSEQQFNEFYTEYINAIDASLKNPFDPSTGLDYGLADWHRIKFHSVAKPARGDNPDSRFLYRYDEVSTDFYKLAVGPRNPKGVTGDSIYKIGKDRLKGRNVWTTE